MMREVLVLLAVSVLSACGAPSAPPDVPPVSADTTLGPGDVFDVRVFGEDELSGTYQVSSSGTIDYPLIGRFDVSGLEPNGLADALAKQLQDGEFLRNPQVSVFVQEYNSKKVNIVGAVAKPGNYPVGAGLTAVQLVSIAGGLTSLAAGNDVVVTRQTDNGPLRFKVPVAKASEGRAQDVPLQAGDIVYVPERVF